MIKIKVPIRLIPPNQLKHWSQRHKQNKIARLLIKSELNKIKFKPPEIPRYHIRLTRIAPRKIDDHDSLPQSFKGIVDIIADILLPGLAPGMADGSPLFQWTFDQRKGKPKEYAIEVTLEPWIPDPVIL